MINVKAQIMKIKSVRKIGKFPVYDISVEDNQQYILENGIVSHNTGSYYGADNIWILGRQQDKGADKKIAGYEFVINVEKSRFVKEKSKILINVSHTTGINKWSGLLEVAVEGGFVVKTKPGKYTVVNPLTGEIIGDEMKEADIDTNADVWKALLADQQFTTYIRNKYQLSTSNILRDDKDEQAGE